MLSDKHIKLIYDYPATYGVFGDVAIAGGVSYFLWERDRDPKETFCDFNGVSRDIGEFDVLIRDNASVSIIRKVLKHKGTFCNGLVMPRKPFGMGTNFSDWVSQGTATAVKIYSVNQQIQWALANSIMDTNGILVKHKVCMSKVRSQGIIDAEGNGEASPVFGKTFQIPKGEACTETYIVVGSFNSKKEADNYEAYLHTKFYKFCLRNRISGQDINREKFAWVPDFGNYANPVTDEDLYANFNLTKKEIEHIESTIK
jgi:site-specific DNA-methyltransferase (adenine-specific)